MKKITADTKIVSIFGTPVNHSLSPLIQNYWFKANKINYIYTAFDVKENDLKTAATAMKIFSMPGANVTVPHKTNIIKYLNNIDKTARIIGSVNTIVNKNGKLTGFNTDGDGFAMDLESKKIAVKNKNILVVGAGGAARAILYALKQNKAKNIYLTSKTIQNAQKLADYYKNIKVIDIKNIPGDFLKNINLLVNCSTCGMKPSDVMPFEIKQYNKKIVFYDLIYNKITPFYNTAKRLKLKYFSGEGMLVFQGAAAFKLWTGIFPDTKQAAVLIKKALR